MMSRMTMTSEE